MSEPETEQIGGIHERHGRMAIDSCLATILGREACLRKGRMTMDELLKANERLEVDLDGLKALANVRHPVHEIDAARFTAPPPVAMSASRHR